LTLNLNKTQFLQFKLNYSALDNIQKPMINSTEVKFLGLILDDTLTWKKHSVQLVNKLSSACYALRNLRPLLSQDTLKTVYHAYLHSMLSYGIICWGGSSQAKKKYLSYKKKHQNNNKF